MKKGERKRQRENLADELAGEVWQKSIRSSFRFRERWPLHAIVTVDLLMCQLQTKPLQRNGGFIPNFLHFVGELKKSIRFPPLSQIKLYILNFTKLNLNFFTQNSNHPLFSFTN